MAGESSMMITFLGDPETKRKLAELAAKSERSQSAWLRWVIRREYENQICGESLPDDQDNGSAPA